MCSMNASTVPTRRRPLQQQPASTDSLTLVSFYVPQHEQSLSVSHKQKYSPTSMAAWLNLVPDPSMEYFIHCHHHQSGYLLLRHLLLIFSPASSFFKGRLHHILVYDLRPCYLWPTSEFYTLHITIHTFFIHSPPFTITNLHHFGILNTFLHSPPGCFNYSVSED